MTNSKVNDKDLFPFDYSIISNKSSNYIAKHSNVYANYSYYKDSSTLYTTGTINESVTDISDSSSSMLGLSYNDGIFFVLLILLSLIAYVKISGKNYISRIVTSIVNYSYSKSFFKEKNLNHNLYDVVLLGVFIISTSILATVLSDYFNFGSYSESKWIYLGVCTVFTGLFLLIHAIIFLLLEIFTKEISVFTHYLFFCFNLLRVASLPIVFLLFGAVFSVGIGKSVFIYISIFIYVLALLLRVYRILLIFFDNRFPLYYMILYFCALEIVPLLFTIKIFSKNLI